MMKSKEAKAFDLSDEPAKVKEAYGDGKFGQGCLLARRLVETGVPFVEVTLGGWDTHQDNFNRVKKLSAGVRPGDVGPGPRPEGPRHAGRHADHLDGRVRPDAEDQPARRHQPGRDHYPRPGPR